MLINVVTQGFWILERLLVRLGAPPGDTTVGQKIHAVKSVMPDQLYRELLEINDIRANLTHEARFDDVQLIAKRIHSAYERCRAICREKQLSVSISHPVPNGRISILDFVTHPLPSTRTDYVHLTNGGSERIPVQSLSMEIWDVLRAELVVCRELPLKTGSFDPGEHMYMMLCEGQSGFNAASDKAGYTVDHWDVYLGEVSKQTLLRAPKLALRFLDATKIPLAELRIEKARY